ncbi:MAG: hypothetical protein ACK5HR_02215 [Mycoplasmatales bacterium]
MKIKNETIFKDLKTVYNVEEVKYDVLSKTFIYRLPNNQEKSLTFASLLNILDKSTEIYSVLDRLRSSYFPRRLKEVITTFYQDNNLQLPNELIIGEQGFEVLINNKLYFINYDDDFTKILHDFAKVYNLQEIEITIKPQIADYEGHYHQG